MLRESYSLVKKIAAFATLPFVALIIGCASDPYTAVQSYESGVKNQVAALQYLLAIRSDVNDILYRQSLIDRAEEYPAGIVSYVPDPNSPQDTTSPKLSAQTPLSDSKRNQELKLGDGWRPDYALLELYAGNLSKVAASNTTSAMNGAISDATLSTRAGIAGNRTEPGNELSLVDGFSGLLTSLSSGYLRSKKNNTVHQMTSDGYIALDPNSPILTDRAYTPQKAHCQRKIGGKLNSDTAIGCNGELLRAKSLEVLTQSKLSMDNVRLYIEKKTNAIYRDLGNNPDSSKEKINQYTSLLALISKAQYSMELIEMNYLSLDRGPLYVGKSTKCLNELTQSGANATEIVENGQCIAKFSAISDQMLKEVIAARALVGTLSGRTQLLYMNKLAVMPAENQRANGELQ